MEPLVADQAWQLLSALAERARRGEPVIDRARFRVSAGEGVRTSEGAWNVALEPDAPRGWESRGPIAADAALLLDIHVPLCVGPRAASLTLAHLGQSLDGRIATRGGASRFITGPEDVRHMHRLRALFSAVVVGARTVENDDPCLTTRLVRGANPTRVVLDPHGRLDGTYRVFTDDAAPTLCFRGPAPVVAASRRSVEFVELALVDDQIPIMAVIASLKARGLRRVFVEGGGVTVSRFLEAGALDRLHVTVAPMIMGSGRPAFELAPIDRIVDAVVPRCRHFSLGGDVLFDCDLHASPPTTA